MKRLINQALTAAVALMLLTVVACNDKNGSTVNVESIKFSADTILINKGDELQLQVTTVPADAPLRFMASSSHAGMRVVSVDDAGKVKGLAGGKATIVAIASNGEAFTEAKTTVIVSEKVEEINTGPSNVFYMFSLDYISKGSQWESETARAMDVSTSVLFTPLQFTADNRAVKLISLDDPTGKWALVPDNPNAVYYTERATGTNNTNADNHDKYTKSVAHLTVGSEDGGATKTIELRNAAYLKITASSSGYTTYGYFPYGLFDSRTDVGGWHSSNTMPSTGHLIQIDFREPVTISGVELWRSTTDSKDVEVFTNPSMDDGITYRDAGYTQYGKGTFATSQLIISGPKVTTRYLRFKFPNSNRGNNCNLTEIRPYIITE